MIEFTEEDRERLNRIVFRHVDRPWRHIDREDRIWLGQLVERPAGDAGEKRYGSVEEIKRDFFPTLHAEDMAAAKARSDAEPDELPDALATVEAAALEARDERDAALAKLKAAGDTEGLREKLTSDEVKSAAYEAHMRYQNVDPREQSEDGWITTILEAAVAAALTDANPKGGAE